MFASFASFPFFWDLAICNELDQTQVWCTINDHPACVEAIHVGPGGRAVLLHFQVYHPHILQFIETEMKQVVRALPYNAPYTMALSIIPTINDAVSGERYGFWLDGQIIALTTFNVDTLEVPVTLTGNITVCQYGTVMTFTTQKKEIVINFVDMNSVLSDVPDATLDAEHDPLDPLELDIQDMDIEHNPIEPDIQEIKIEEVKIECDDSISWRECFKDYL